jgi:hypothetical protein
VKIIPFASAKAPTDLAIIQLNNPQKLQQLYRGYFEIGLADSVSESEIVHLTGFSCDIPDVLVDKRNELANIDRRTNRNLIGYQMYCRTGDSGAPIWMDVMESQLSLVYIIGVGRAIFRLIGIAWQKFAGKF